MSSNNVIQEPVPHIAVIIPARNEEKYIAQLLDSIVATPYDKTRLTVVVADGMSTDKTQEIVRAYETNHRWIKLKINEHKTTPYAFNIGIRETWGADIYITVGSHAEVYPDFFERVVECFSISPEIGCVGGVLENVYENDTAENIGMAMSSPFGVGNAHFRTGAKEGYVDTVGFPAYKREVFEKTGLFNEALTRNQDDEFNYRVAKAGFKIYLSKSIRSKYYVRGAYDKLYRQYYQYGYWKVYVNRLHKTITTMRQLVPPAFVAFLVVGFIFSFFTWFLAGFYVGVILCYAAGGFYFASKVSKNMKQSLDVTWVFMILHVSYGLGYLKGLLDFSLMRKSPAEKHETLSR